MHHIFLLYNQDQKPGFRAHMIKNKKINKNAPDLKCGEWGQKVCL